MSAQPVEWVLVVRYGSSAHRATYGRLTGSTTYTKDYIQLSRKREFIDHLQTAFPALGEGDPFVAITYKWPAGSADGKIIGLSADRPHLAWVTDKAPDPWRMLDRPTILSAETIRGDPSHTADRAADLELQRLISSEFGQPFLVAVKLRGEDDTLHLRVLVENPEEQVEWADLKSAPSEIQELAAKTSLKSALAWRLFVEGDGSQGLHFDPDKKADAWNVLDAGPTERVEATESLEAQGSPDPSDLDSDLFAEGLAHSEEEVSEFERRLSSGEYEVSDSFATKKTRGSAQRAFAAEVKKNYGWTCALTGIQTKAFLIASHIVPWSIDEKIRLDPSNGICLSVLVDRAFENGILVVEDDLTVRVNSEEVGGDLELMRQLRVYDGMKLGLPKAHRPKVEYLRRRRSL